MAIVACSLLMALPLTVTMAAGLSQDEALKLARQSGCLTCHKIDKKLMGPAWTDVAERYKGKPDARAMLIEKVRKGGRGNWSEVTHNMMMPPTPKRVSDEDIAKLVDFILSLDKG
jgi:cytochrome c